MTTPRSPRRAHQTIGAALIVALACVCVAPAAPVAAQDAGAPEMKRAIDTYFDGERDGAYGFMAHGLLSLSAGGVLAFQDDDTLRAMSWPLLIAGLGSASIGALIHFRTDSQVADLHAQLGQDPATFKREETDRVEGIDLTLNALLVVETLLVLGGIGAGMVGMIDDHPNLEGWGWGFAIAGASLFPLDLWAERRASAYLDALNAFKSQQAGSAATALELRGVF